MDVYFNWVNCLNYVFLYGWFLRFVFIIYVFNLTHPGGRKVEYIVCKVTKATRIIIIINLFAVKHIGFLFYHKRFYYLWSSTSSINMMTERYLPYTWSILCITCSMYTR